MGRCGLAWRDRQFCAGTAGDLKDFTPPAEPNPGTETAVLPEGPGRLWIGTRAKWIVAAGERPIRKRPFPSDSINTVVRCLYTNRTGALWIGSEFGLSSWDKGTLKRFTAAEGFPAAYVLSIAQDSAGDDVVWHCGRRIAAVEGGKISFISCRPLR